VIGEPAEVTRRTANEKGITFRFVAHLVGDIHQPLPAGFAEDCGGNSVEMRFNGRKEKLHSLWNIVSNGSKGARQTGA
jgi:hypothetical protein